MSIENPIANDYIIELPELIDLLPSKDVIQTLTDEKLASSTCNPEFISDWDGQTWYSCKDNEDINYVCSKLTTSHVIEAPEVWLTQKEEGKWVRPHVDTDRLAVLIYPIVPTEYKLQFTDKWYDEDNSSYNEAIRDLFLSPYSDTALTPYEVIHEHTYTCPTLLNSKIPHCVPETFAKTTFQISLYYGDATDTWEKVLAAHAAGTLLN